MLRSSVTLPTLAVRRAFHFEDGIISRNKNMMEQAGRRTTTSLSSSLYYCGSSRSGGGSMVLTQQQRKQIFLAAKKNVNRICYNSNNSMIISGMCRRSLSSSTSNNKSETHTTQKKEEGDTNDDKNDESAKQIVLTPGEKVVVYGRFAMWSVMLSLAAVCGYYIFKELLPTKMSPNRVFNTALVAVRENELVKRRYGDTLKGYGRDHGGKREGRRNFIEHTEYKDEEDGSNRTRVRFNLEGENGQAFVFAEVSSDMPSGEFVYVLVQDKATGQVETVIDNRSAMTAARLTGGNQEQMAAMSQLLSGGREGKN